MSSHSRLHNTAEGDDTKEEREARSTEGGGTHDVGRLEQGLRGEEGDKGRSKTCAHAQVWTETNAPAEKYAISVRLCTTTRTTACRPISRAARAFGGAGADARAAADAPADVADAADAADVADAFDAADAAGAADAADEADTVDDAKEAGNASKPFAATMRPPDEAADPAAAPEGGTRNSSAAEETGCTTCARVESDPVRVRLVDEVDGHVHGEVPVERRCRRSTCATDAVHGAARARAEKQHMRRAVDVVTAVRVRDLNGCASRKNTRE